jgi:hypothetical protein
MPRLSPAIFGARFCTKCGQRQRSANHTCQPSAIKKYVRLQEWNKKSVAAGQPAKPKK